MSNIILSLYVLCTSLGLVVLKLGTSTGLPLYHADGKWHFALNGLTVTGILMYGASFLLYLYLISKNDLGYIIPLTTGLVYILIFVASFYVFKESFTATKILAIILILSGVILLNIRK